MFLDHHAGKLISSYIFLKKDQAVTMDTKSTIKIQDEHVQVDLQLLFQRLLIVGMRNGEFGGVLVLQTFLDHLKSVKYLIDVGALLHRNP